MDKMKRENHCFQTNKQTSVSLSSAVSVEWTSAAQVLIANTTGTFRVTLYNVKITITN
jgi:hypothetical protein